MSISVTEEINGRNSPANGSASTTSRMNEHDDETTESSSVGAYTQRNNKLGDVPEAHGK